MPDHWHGLVALGERDYLPSLVQRLTANTGRHVRQADPRVGRAWGSGYRDRGLRAEERLVDAARYLVLHQVRGGLGGRTMGGGGQRLRVRVVHWGTRIIKTKKNTSTQ